MLQNVLAINYIYASSEKYCYHWFPWHSLTIHPYQSSLLAGPLYGIQCPHRADEYKSLLVAITGVSMHWSPQKNFVYEFIPTSPAVPTMPCLSYLDNLWDGRQVLYNSCIAECCFQDLEQHAAYLNNSHRVFFSEHFLIISQSIIHHLAVG